MIYDHEQEDDNLSTDLVNDLPTNLTVNAITYVTLDSSERTESYQGTYGRSEININH